jgi:putative transport protein
MELLRNPIFLLLLVIIVGDAIGRLRVLNFQFGTSAIVFVALAFGHFGFVLPKEFQTLGLVLFIYSIGLQAGPGFLSSFKSHGLRQTLGASSMVVVAFVTSVALCWILGLDAGTGAGLLAGAMTSTPGLAVAVEMADSSAAAAAYGLTYTFGVLSVILFVKLLPRILKIDVKQEEDSLKREMAEQHPPLMHHHVEVTNQNLFGRSIKDIHLREVAPVTITRLLRRGGTEPVLVSGDTALREGDRLRLVGRQADLEKLELFIGVKVDEEVAFDRVLVHRDIVVSKPQAAGQPIAALRPRTVFNVQIARIMRSGMDLPATAETRLHVGDTLRVVGDARSVSNIAKLLGNDVEETFTASILAILLGLFVGFLVGQIPFPLPWVGTFKLGTTGGVLLAGLVLSGLYKTGPVIWAVPSTTNQFLRDLGLMLFLATVGTAAGATIVATLRDQGLGLFLSGVAVSIVPLVFSVVLCRYVLKIPFLRMLGVIAGGMTSTPGLAAASSLSRTGYASSAYATVYPVALIAMIVCAKLLVLVLGGG